ncbi:cytochrome c biogenesis protein CcsA [Wolinella succinogenes]|nr:cytochrome c biogenesis protein CcsA [Wolinella succinogenes]NLU34759.1 cytochrome c biogenesis protein CcsA [Wolinella succinogenes]VEG81319.1 cytochrome c-type biogenesis protein CcsB [Wolinella succinogenes]HCZ19213.1 cytochrome C biogenesis protein [Helicobacter sp.]
MNWLKNTFGSFWLTLPLLFLYALACAVATFIENDYGTASAKALIYSTRWFDALHLLLTLNLIATLFLSQAWQRKKWASLLFHSSLIVIVIGAGITRYFGFEGTLHIREGQTQNRMTSQEPYLIVRALEGDQKYYAEFPLPMAPLGKKDFDYKVLINGEPLHLIYLDYQPSQNPKSSEATLEIKAHYKGETQTLALEGGNDLRGITVPADIGGAKFLMEWGIKEIPLPFSLKLERFELERYPGSMSPSSYASEVIVIDEGKNIEMPYRIYMNHTLDYGGYRFFQSSYDRDEKGTILSVNNDPGKLPTYIGYAMLTLGLLWNFFARNGRFYRLGRFVRSQNIGAFLVAILLALALHPSSLSADENTLRMLSNLQAHSKAHAKEFGNLLVQDFGGRIKPIDTLASDYVHKITKKEKLLGLEPTQIFLGMLMYPNEWKQVKMIKITTPRLKEVLGVPLEDGYIAFEDVFEGNRYKLSNYVEEANRKKPAMRDKFDKDVQSVDERLNVAYLIYTAQALRLFPDMEGMTDKWHSPIEAIQTFSERDASFIQGILQEYFIAFDKGVEDNEWGDATKALGNFVALQTRYGSNLILPPSRIKAEIWLNHSQIFARLSYAYILLGLALFGVVFIGIIRAKSASSWLSKGLFYLILFTVLLHTLGLGLRWYVAGHAPWSNAYESMIYIAWAAAISGALFFRRSSLALSTASILAGISLFVAHLGFMDPQITNLVPVLKSYWLNIHVSVITASYGFLGLSFMLGFIALLMFALRHPQKPQLDASILSITAINEMSMVIGLAMLTVGNFLGGVWANESWGRYWGWDPKETWSLISIVLYTLILHVRFIKGGDKPYVLASLSVLGFYSILMTYFGVNFYLSGLHSYAAGDPLPIPSFLYYLVALTFALILLGGRKGDLEAPKLP